MSAARGKTERAGAQSNFISEWFGHRIYPTIVSTDEALADQNEGRCPFLSIATAETRECVKSARAKGVCTISCVSNGPRQDWLVCPYRALSPELVTNAIKRLFALPHRARPFITPAVALAKDDVRADINRRLADRQKVFVYFAEKTGGELSIPRTARSPEFSFDVTVVELSRNGDAIQTGRFGILEIQTMDFHGSYGAAVKNLQDALRLNRKGFGVAVQKNQWWLAEDVEGPNIANVFKRTFYQMMFKFQLGSHALCAGCVLAIPKSVWDSWQSHLGAPTLSRASDGTSRLLAPNHDLGDACPAWIYVFDTDPSSTITPSPIVVSDIIGTDAHCFSHWALDVAPAAALENIDEPTGFLGLLARRLMRYWPELARTVKGSSSRARL